MAGGTGFFATYRKFLLTVRALLILVIIAAVTAFIVFTDVVDLPEAFDAMEPSIERGARLLVLVHPSESSLKRFSVVFFEPPGKSDKQALGRIIALPGETVSSSEGVVFVNSRPLNESFYPPGKPRPALPEDIPEYKVPQGSYFILVDNRSRTGIDSRDFGAIPFGNIVSRVLVKF